MPTGSAWAVASLVEHLKGFTQSRMVRSRAGRVLVVAVSVVLVSGALLYRPLYKFGYDYYSQHVIAPQLREAELALKEKHDPAVGLKLVEPVLKRYPDDAHVLYFVASLHWRMGDQLRAIFFSIAYLRSPHTRDPGELEHLASLLLVDNSVPDFFDGMGPESRAFLGHLIDSLPLEPAEKAVLKGQARNAGPAGGNASEHSLPGEIQQSAELSASLPPSWAKKTVIAPQDLLGMTGAHAPDGVVQIAGAVSCEEIWCPKLFKDANLWNAIARAELDIKYEPGGANCCSLALSDDDLRPVRQITSAWAMERERESKGRPDETAEGINALLGLRQRVLMKQAYLLSFVVFADAR